MIEGTKKEIEALEEVYSKPLDLTQLPELERAVARSKARHGEEKRRPYSVPEIKYIVLRLRAGDRPDDLAARLGRTAPSLRCRIQRSEYHWGSLVAEGSFRRQTKFARQLFKERRDGATYVELGKKYSIHATRARQLVIGLVKRLGLDPSVVHVGPHNTLTPEQIQELPRLAARVRKGETLAEVGASVGLTGRGLHYRLSTYGFLAATKKPKE